jgi:hypothetical protein
MIPSDQNTFTDQDFLNMLNEEIQYFGVPHLLRTHEEYLVRFEDQELESGKTRYAIPYRAVGNKLRDAALVDSANSYFELSRISLEELSDYNRNNLTSFSDAFYVENNNIVLLNQSTDSDINLRMYFYLRPNKLVEDDKAGVITDINRTSGIITMSNFPEAFSNQPLMDFVGHKTPNKIFSYDKQPTSVNSSAKSITFNIADIPDELGIGDYINFAGESIVPQLPTELHPILAQRVMVAALEGLGDFEGADKAEIRLKKMEQSVLTIIDDRVEGAPQKIKNRYSPLRESVLGNGVFRRGGKF